MVVWWTGLSSLRRSTVYLISLCGLLVALMAAPTSAMAAASLFSVEDNVAYAISAICAPFALDSAERANLPIGHGLVQPDGYDGLAAPNPTGVRVGGAGFVHVTFSQKSDGSRSCDVQARGTDPQVLRRIALTALTERAEHFEATKSKYLPGSRFVSENMLCASADSAHPAAFVLLSSPPSEERNKIAILFTLGTGGVRMASCDQEGVRLNFRALAAP